MIAAPTLNVNVWGGGSMVFHIEEVLYRIPMSVVSKFTGMSPIFPLQLHQLWRVKFQFSSQGDNQQGDQTGNNGSSVVRARVALRQLEEADQHLNADANKDDRHGIFEEALAGVSAVVGAAILTDTWTGELSEVRPLITSLFDGISITPSICEVLLKDILGAASPIVERAAVSITPLPIMA